MEALRIIRKEKGMTQKELAKQVGMTGNAICNYEKNLREPRLSDVKKLADALDCTVDELLRDPKEAK